MNDVSDKTNDTSEADDSKMYDKVAKILAKAERAGTPEEAELFFGKAQELITRYALNELALHDKINGGDGKREEVGDERIFWKSSYFDEDARLWGEVSRANSCTILLLKYGSTKGIILVGTATNRANVKMLVASLNIQVARGSRALPNNLARATAFDKFVWRRSFRSGFATVIGRRLKEAKEGAARTHKSGDMLPVLLSQAAEVEAYTEDKYSPKAGRMSRKRASWEGRDAGRRAGERADVGATRVQGTKGALPKGGA